MPDACCDFSQCHHHHNFSTYVSHWILLATNYRQYKMEMHWYNAIVFLLLATAVSCFCPSTPPQSVHHAKQNVSLRMTPPNHDNNRRRHVLIQSGLLGLFTTFPSSPALAKKESSEPLLTKENVQTAFSSLQFELDDPNGGVSIMQRYIDDEDFEQLREFTKTYDQILRKQKWGRCKSLFTSSAEKEVATLQGNAVTFDLIGINRASRVGQESVTRANKYLNELRVDLQKMVEMQSTIRYDQDGSFGAYMNAIQGN